MTADRVRLLALVAILQLLLIAFLYWPRDAGDAGAATPALLPSGFAPTQVLIEDDTGARVSLRLEAEAWLLDDSLLPAARGEVESLLEALSAAPGFPVANTVAARDRFAVDEDNFRRRITLSGDPAHVAQVILLGTSPGIGRSHARREDGQAILPVGLSVHDVPARVDDWLNPNLLALPDIDALGLDGQRWAKRDGAWKLALGSEPAAGAASPQPAEAPAVPDESLQALQRALASVQVRGLADAPPDLTHADSGAPLDFSVSQAGDTVALRLLAGSDGQPPRLYSSARERWFTISRYDHDRLRDALDGVRSRPGSDGTRAGT
jgi:hypothetical protein